jgi:hypothetical protein
MKRRRNMKMKLESNSFMIKALLFLIGLLLWSIPIGIIVISELLRIDREFSNNFLVPLVIIMFFFLILLAMNGWDSDNSNYGNIIGNIIKFIGVLVLAAVFYLGGFILVFYWTARGALRLYYEPPELFYRIKDKISK